MTSNFNLKLLSVLLASSTWLITVYAGNPPQARTISNVPVRLGLAPPGLVLAQDPPRISVSVVGLRNDVAAFTNDSVRASVDISSAREGSNNLRVKVENLSAVRAVTLDAVPGSVDIELDKLVTVTKKLDVRTKGQAGTCCAVGHATADPDSVSLTGPSKLLDTAVAYVTLDVSGAQTDVHATVQVFVADPKGKPLPQIAPNPTTVAETVPISQNKQQRRVAVSPDVEGQPAAGYHVTRIDYSPQLVDIEGDPSVIAAITSIDTDIVGINGQTSDVSVTVKLKPKAGVTVLTPGPFTVHVFISPDVRVEATPSPSATVCPTPSAGATPPPKPAGC